MKKYVIKNILVTNLSSIYSVLVVMFTFFGQALNAQDLESYKNYGIKKGIKVKGGLNFNSVYNAPSGSQPISYFVSGTLNLNMFGYNVPLNLNYSNRQFSYSQPFSFNYASITPSYKWASASIGTSFMTFSPYSLNGHQFQGIGLTLTPNKWSFSMMYGQLNKAQNGDTLANAKLLPTYRRIGMGLKTVYRADKYMAGLTIFHADDKIASLSLPKTNMPQAKENLVIGFELGTTLFKQIQLQADYTTSAIIQDKSNEENQSLTSKSVAGYFLSKNPSLVAYHAMKVSANYNLEVTKSVIGISYQRVDPNYTTLGGYYFVNDFQNLTFNLAQSLLKGKLNFNGNFGIQNDDLSNTKGTKQKRFVGMVNLNANPTEKLTLSLNLSNFTSYTFIRTAFDEIKRINPFEQLDTLNYQQITQNINSNIAYVLSQSETKNQSLGLNLSFMQSADIQGGIVRQGGQSGFVNGTATYALQMPKKFFSVNGGFNTSLNTIGRDRTSSIGPVLNIMKGFFKNALTTNYSTSLIHSSNSTNSSTADALNLRFSGRYQYLKKHNFSSNIGYTSSMSSGMANRNYASITFGYGMTF